ncbi:hypothetical protein TEA_000165 [Camellia sinensis var. sinensis]|uniref:Uncharacterized protein n=1 Tax=Camellia sinensis var. sinensis TaxID=542762 RepID=A0A4S4F2M4_CAMSN|nr:hypothetical protein TEA_000165 [Camellia sinensis var. sinensis]
MSSRSLMRRISPFFAAGIRQHQRLLSSSSSSSSAAAAADMPEPQSSSPSLSPSLDVVHITDNCVQYIEKGRPSLGKMTVGVEGGRWLWEGGRWLWEVKVGESGCQGWEGESGGRCRVVEGGCGYSGGGRLAVVVVDCGSV